MKNNDLVDIVYSESIYQYVIIIKRFPNMPVVIHDNDIDEIFGLIHGHRLSILIYDDIYGNINNQYYGLELSKTDEKSNIYCAICDVFDDNTYGDVLYEESITIEERNEILNKLKIIFKI